MHIRHPTPPYVCCHGRTRGHRDAAIPRSLRYIWARSFTSPHRFTISAHMAEMSENRILDRTHVGRQASALETPVENPYTEPLHNV